MAAANIPDAVFDELNYETWAQMAKTRLVGKGVWDVVESGVPPDPTKPPELAATIKAEALAQWRDRVIKDMKALKIMQSSLTDSAFRKTVSVASAKDLWCLLEKGNEEAKVRRLEKEFDEFSMYYGEPMEAYLDRVLDLLIRSRNSATPKSDDELIGKLLPSLSCEYDDAAPILEEIMNLPDMTLNDLIDMFHMFGDHPESMAHMLKDYYVSLKKAKSEQLWCGLCKTYDHNVEDCYYNPMATNSSGARKFDGLCYQCGERGHYARDCSGRNQQQKAAPQKAQIDQKRNEKRVHSMLAATMGGFTFDEGMWMVYTNASDHMTPYAKFFTTLDRTYKGQVLLADGRVFMAEGRGDVNIVMKGVKKTIKNVLFVPRINRNVLSVGQMTSGGYTVTMEASGCTIKDETGNVFAKTEWEERGLVLRLQVIKGNRLTS